MESRATSPAHVVQKRPIFAFVEREIRPNDQIIAFMFDDDYSFGILQSNLHWKWFQAKLFDA